MKPNYITTVHQIARKIPYGRVSTYGAIAHAIGTVTPRMVGWAMNQSPSSDENVPAHRVVNSKGELTGRHHFPTPYMMQELLEEEGIEVENFRVKDFKTVFWNPIDELLDSS